MIDQRFREYLKIAKLKCTMNLGRLPSLRDVGIGEGNSTFNIRKKEKEKRFDIENDKVRVRMTLEPLGSPGKTQDMAVA